MQITIEYKDKKKTIHRSNDFATRKTIVINKRTLESKTFVSMAQASRFIGKDDKYIANISRYKNYDINYFFIVGERKAW